MNSQHFTQSSPLAGWSLPTPAMFHKHLTSISHGSSPLAGWSLPTPVLFYQRSQTSYFLK